MPKVADLTPPDMDEVMKRTRVWVEGEAMVYPHIEDQVLARDHLIKHAEALGLHVHVQPIEGEDPPRRRMSSGRRVPLEAVSLTLAGFPGISLEEITLQCFKTYPWTPLAQEVAKRNCLVALSRLKKEGRAVRIVDEQGTHRWGPKGWAYGKHAAPPLPEGVTAEMAKAGAAEAGGDPFLAVRIFKAMEAARPS
jgi:hypothetical protein